MKLIIAIIQPHRLEEVKKALYAADVNLILVSHAHGDRLDLASLRRLRGRAAVLVPPRCASLPGPEQS